MRPVDRSMNTELTEGMVDGKVKRLNPDRGGLPEQTTQMHRTSLSSDYDNVGDCLSSSDERPDVVGVMP